MLRASCSVRGVDGVWIPVSAVENSPRRWCRAPTLVSADAKTTTVDGRAGGRTGVTAVGRFPAHFPPFSWSRPPARQPTVQYTGPQQNTGEVPEEGRGEKSQRLRTADDTRELRKKHARTIGVSDGGEREGKCLSRDLRAVVSVFVRGGSSLAETPVVGRTATPVNGTAGGEEQYASSVKC